MWLLYSYWLVGLHLIVHDFDGGRSLVPSSPHLAGTRPRCAPREENADFEKLLRIFEG